MAWMVYGVLAIWSRFFDDYASNNWCIDVQKEIRYALHTIIEG